MTSIGKKRLGRVLDEGEVFGLAFMAVLLIIVEACCVCFPITLSPNRGSWLCRRGTESPVLK
jgi:hypothetical protein